MFLLNGLKTPDIVFFSVIGGVIALCIIIYFLIPVIKRKEFAERRANLKKREEVFRANLKNLQNESIKVEESENKKEEVIATEAKEDKKGNSDNE